MLTWSVDMFHLVQFAERLPVLWRTFLTQFLRPHDPVFSGRITHSVVTPKQSEVARAISVIPETKQATAADNLAFAEGAFPIWVGDQYRDLAHFEMLFGAERVTRHCRSPPAAGA